MEDYLLRTKHTRGLRHSLMMIETIELWRRDFSEITLWRRDVSEGRLVVATARGVTIHYWFA